MALIKSISGIRGTIGGRPDEGLTPLDIVKYTAAYAAWVLESTGTKRIVVGRDARPSGPMVQSLVTGTLIAMGVEVINLGLTTTPTVEIAVPELGAGGGIIITASHNPKNWNALKLLNSDGEFINDEQGKALLLAGDKGEFVFAEIDGIGSERADNSFLQRHIDVILALPYVKVEAIRAAGFKVVIDCVNSSGGIYLPALLAALGVENVVQLNCEPTGQFAHNPEPLPENLTEIADAVKAHNADLGIVVDPDVDRLCFVNEDGSMFGEEYTLVAVADYIMETHGKPAVTVSNLSSTRALKDVTEARGGKYYAAAVGEVNVVKAMKAHGALIGGEGNGGIILPELHYGRDALAGAAIFLTMLAERKQKMTAMKATFPPYVISKNKMELGAGIDYNNIINSLKQVYSHADIDETDGLKINLPEGWVQLRKSNTEPIIRIYSEAADESLASKLAQEVITHAKNA